ncbi:MAG: hypothetical protein ACXWP0_21585 [Ktedonobacterales bacterium]
MTPHPLQCHAQMLSALHNIFAEATDPGQPIFAAAGDNGSDDSRRVPQTDAMRRFASQ